MDQHLSGNNLKRELWRALLGVKEKRITPEAANAIAATAREILRVVKLEMDIAYKSDQRIPSGLLTYLPCEKETASPGFSSVSTPGESV